MLKYHSSSGGSHSGELGRRVRTVQPFDLQPVPLKTDGDSGRWFMFLGRPFEAC